MIPNEVYCSECPEWSETGCSKGIVDTDDCAYMDKGTLKYSEELWDKSNEQVNECFIEPAFDDDDIGEEE